MFNLLQYCPTVEQFLDGHLLNISTISGKSVSNILTILTESSEITSGGSGYIAANYTYNNVTYDFLINVANSTNANSYINMSTLYTKTQGVSDKTFLITPSYYAGSIPGKLNNNIFITHFKYMTSARNATFKSSFATMTITNESNYNTITDVSENSYSLISNKDYLILWQRITIDSVEYIKPKYLMEFTGGGTIISASLIS